MLQYKPHPNIAIRNIIQQLKWLHHGLVYFKQFLNRNIANILEMKFLLFTYTNNSTISHFVDKFHQTRFVQDGECSYCLCLLTANVLDAKSKFLTWLPRKFLGILTFSSLYTYRLKRTLNTSVQLKSCILKKKKRYNEFNEKKFLLAQITFIY